MLRPFFFQNETKKDGKVDSIVTEKIYNTLANHAEDKQMMEKTAQRWFISFFLVLLYVVAEGECGAECVARYGCVHALDWLVFQFCFVVEGKL